MRRCGSPGNPLVDAVVVQNILETATSYEEFRGDDSQNYHAIGHVTLGGMNCDMGNPYFSPNDPIFYCNSAFLSFNTQNSSDF